MIKLETHLHSKGGSGCARVTNEEIIVDYKKAGYTGLCLTNHNCLSCTDTYPGKDYHEKLNFYFSLKNSLKELAEKNGFRFFWGAETRVITYDSTYQEYMLYGLTEKFMFDNRPLFTYTQQELFKLCDKNGIFMYQTHPFRDGVVCGDPHFVHGLEVYNGHWNHENHNEKSFELAKKYNLKMMSGTDYHDFSQPIRGGILIPDNINGNEELVEYLFNNQPELLIGK